MAAVLLLGCAAGQEAQYTALIQDGNFAGAKAVMQRQIAEFSVRDLNPTLPLRLGQAYYRLAYAHGRLAEYDSMRSALRTGVSHDPGLFGRQQKMLEHFEAVEFNDGVGAWALGDFRGALVRFRTALSIVESEQPHERCSAGILQAMSLAALKTGDRNSAVEYARRASAIGIDGAEQFAAHLEEGRPPASSSAPEKKKVVVLEGI